VDAVNENGRVVDICLRRVPNADALRAYALLKLWTIAVCNDSEEVCVGCRDDDGTLLKIERLKPSQVSDLVANDGVKRGWTPWQTDRCYDSLYAILEFLDMHVKEDDPNVVYEFERDPQFYRNFYLRKLRNAKPFVPQWYCM
jgi:hypothetical protein